MSTTEKGLLRIGELSRRTGVSPELLRAWERRYGVLQPERTEGGFRLYTRSDEERVLRMVQQLGEGLSAAEAARMALEATPGEPMPETGPGPLEGLSGDLANALDRFDEATAQGILNRLFSLYSAEYVIRDVILPYLAELGERWETGEATIAQEHFASNVIRSRLIQLGGTWETGTGPLAVLACLPEERHELGLLSFGAALRRRGWRVVYLGTDTPIDSLSEAVKGLHPAAVVVAGTTADGFRANSKALKAIGLGATLIIAGPGAGPDLASALGARVLSGDPVTAAAGL